MAKVSNKRDGFWKRFSQTLQRLVERLEDRALQYGYRRLRLHASGRWYVGLVILLGVAAVSSGNNILYLLESFLLGGLMLSGILSEYAVASIELHWRRRDAVAGQPLQDELWIENRGRLPVLCVEVGEWRDYEFEAVGFAPLVPARSRVRVRVRATYPDRGLRSWQGVAVQTSYPFGFAAKLRWIDTPGARLVWPAPLDEDLAAAEPPVARGTRGVSDWVEGEVRPIAPGEDYRGVLWRLSLRGGEPFVRPRAGEQPEVELELDADRARSDRSGFEYDVSRLASRLYALRPEELAVLRIRSELRPERVEGRVHCLDRLASIERETSS